MTHLKGKDVITRTEALMAAFGWKGGTIHQVAEATGCDSTGLLYTEDAEWNQDHKAGWFAYRTCSLEHNQTVIYPGVKGNVQFWLGVAAGVQSSIKQGEDTPKKF